MILSNLNDYCFIFEPNILKVVCENVSNPTKEITLVSNGITLKRNAINSIAYFDMSVIFESYFSSSTFVLNYLATVDDPFLKTCQFTISAAGETTLTNITKNIRWGAYQFDEVDSFAPITFPYWLYMPLVVNSSKNHDGSKVNNSYILGRFTRPVLGVTGAFSYEVMQGADVLQTVNFYPAACPTAGNGHYLHWVDSHGQIWHYMFYKSREKQITTEIKSGEVIPYYPLSLTDSQFGRGKLIEKTKQRSFGCFQSVNENIYPIVESILFSPIVKYWTNNKWIDVKIKDNTVNPLKAGFVDIEFTVELPQDFNQRR